MTSRDFCFWLQGYFELINDPGATTVLSAAQVSMIRNHLSLVFKHEIDPSMGDAKHQETLNAAHKPPQIGGIDPVTGHTYRC